MSPFYYGPVVENHVCFLFLFFFYSFQFTSSLYYFQFYTINGCMCLFYRTRPFLWFGSVIEQRKWHSMDVFHELLKHTVFVEELRWVVQHTTFHVRILILRNVGGGLFENSFTSILVVANKLLSKDNDIRYKV